MGAVCATPEIKKQIEMNKQIEKDIRKEEENSIGDQKLLLLGTGECGKSTILKQMQILHKEGFSSSDRTAYKPLVYSTIVKGLQTIIKAMEEFNIVVDDEFEKDAKLIDALIQSGKYELPFTADVSKVLQRVWNNKTTQVTYAKRSEFQISDNLQVFMDSFERISDPSFVPTVEDVLHIRVPTTGIVQVNFPVKGVMFRVVDVGGQRSERKKWIHLFENVDAVVYISAINEYDQKLSEDGHTNRLRESMELFKYICATQWFIKSAIILFLNKRDLFSEKITKIPMNIFFKEYTGSNTYKECIEHVKKHFIKLNFRKDKKELYIHETCATDTKQIEKIIDSVMFTIMEKNFRKTAIM